ncbi:MAG: DUF6282 family protein [Salinirussus sp.]
MTERIAVDGAVDIHTHVGPSPLERRVDGYECAAEADAAGMDAVVLKEHFLPTVYGAAYVDRLLARDGADVDVHGSLVMNYCNGGFNPFAVETALSYGARVIWAPTIDAAHHAEQTGQLGAFLGREAGPEYDDRSGITALDGSGRLRDPVRLCVEKTAAAGAVLAVGHLSFDETLALTEYATDCGGTVVVDHPTYPVTDLSRSEQETLVGTGAVLNFPFMAISPKYHWIDADALADNIREVGVDNCVLSSDVGQVFNPGVPESLRVFGETLLAEGLSRAEVDAMLKETPKRLLDRD